MQRLLSRSNYKIASQKRARSFIQAHNLGKAASMRLCQSSVPSTFIYNYMEHHTPADYCKDCSFPFKQMGACPIPDHSIIWSFISMIPYIYPILLCFFMLYSRNMQHLKSVSLLGSAYIFGDKVVKNIIRSPRPLFSCKSSFGMPSSHMTVIIALFLCKMNASSSSKYEKIIWLVITILEGLSRVILNYHTVGQVIGGTIFGIVYTMIFNQLWERLAEPKVKQFIQRWLSVPPSQDMTK